MLHVFINKNRVSADQIWFSYKCSSVLGTSQVKDFEMNQNNQSFDGGSCIIELQKDFDSLNHEIVLRKIFNYGTHGSVFEIFGNFSDDRWRFVNVSKTKVQHAQTHNRCAAKLIFWTFFILHNYQWSVLAQNWWSKRDISTDNTSIIKAE